MLWFDWLKQRNTEHQRVNQKQAFPFVSEFDFVENWPNENVYRVSEYLFIAHILTILVHDFDQTLLV